MKAENFFEGKEILITGGTGTIGTALTKQLSQYTCRGIRLYSRDEEKHRVSMEKFKDVKNVDISYLIGDVFDKERLSRAMNGVDIVIHTAALKQVPACEENPIEAVKTNITGTVNVINTAIDNDVERVFFISTDKAVMPINLYGATKCVAEKITLDANQYSPNKTKFSVCRYGNIIGSRGSVIKMWNDSFTKDQPLKITDSEMTRFWITKEFAVKFILHCISNMKGGETFVPLMKSCTMHELFMAFCEYKQMNYDYPTQIVGNRKGEKRHEDITLEDENISFVDSAIQFISLNSCHMTSESTLVSGDFFDKQELIEMIKGVLENG